MQHHKTKFALVTGATCLVVASAAFLTAARPPQPAPSMPGGAEFSFARIYWEYNASANDLGVHVTLDGEDWYKLKITNPKNKKIFEVAGKGPYSMLGLTELFFEGAEPSLEEFPLEELLALFPEGEYEFEGRTLDGKEIESEADFSHAIPDGPEVFSTIAGPDYLRIDWNPVTSVPAGFPGKPVQIVAYQVIVEDFQVTVPASVLSLTVSPEFVAELEDGEHDFEVLAIEASGNQTLTEGVFVK